MIKLSYYVPALFLEETKSAVFSAGAGKIGDYDKCSWQCIGQGQFRALPGSQPFVGKQGEIEFVSEYKVEMMCEDKLIESVITALLKAHPYETPAYEVVKLYDVVMK